MQKKGKGNITPLLVPVRKAVTALLVVIGFVFWLDQAGFKVNSLIAGMGIGGLALALAAQKPIENFFGGITLYLSQPVKMGDFCRFGDTRR